MQYALIFSDLQRILALMPPIPASRVPAGRPTTSAARIDQAPAPGPLATAGAGAWATDAKAASVRHYS
jgi:hypothetical protein